MKKITANSKSLFKKIERLAALKAFLDEHQEIQAVLDRMMSGKFKSAQADKITRKFIRLIDKTGLLNTYSCQGIHRLHNFLFQKCVALGDSSRESIEQNILLWLAHLIHIHPIRSEVETPPKSRYDRIAMMCKECDCCPEDELRMSTIQLFRRFLRLEKQPKVHPETLSTSCSHLSGIDIRVSRVFHIDQHNCIVRTESK
ncbi:MAG: hypothetical protein FWH53_00225 [Leptospirales bacterium]|nr:hypothetical protein [Leptospirales bacterium]